MAGPLPTLRRLRLLNEARLAELDEAFVSGLERRADPRVLLELCDQGALAGGLSVALDLKADELIGPLCARLGGSAARLKVEDVRGRDGSELHVSIDGRAEVLEAPNLFALLSELERAFADDPSVGRLAVLGEWERLLQLWALPRAPLAKLLREPWFQPENREALGG